MKDKSKVEGWKKEHGVLSLVEFDDMSEVIFKTPSRKELKLIMSKGRNGGAVGMSESFVRNCYLGGDVTKEDILDDNNTTYLGQVVGSFDDLVGVKQKIVKKL